MIKHLEQIETEKQSPESGAIIELIGRAASDPNVDIDKMERLLKMQQEIWDRDAKQLFTQAFAKMQTALPEIDEKGKGHNDTTYAKWNDINETIKPILAEHGFGLSFRTKDNEKGITVTAVLSHESGHSEETSFTFAPDTSGSKNAIQAVGSSVAYGKRYTASAILNLTSRLEPDNDGEGGPIDKGQFKELQDLIDETGTDTAAFCQYMKVPSLAELPAAKLEKAKNALLAKKAKKQ